MPDDDALLLAADWLEEAEFENEQLNVDMRGVAVWLREQIQKNEKRAFTAKLRLLAANLNQPLPKVRAIIIRTAKNNNMSEAQLLDAFCKEKGIG